MSFLSFPLKISTLVDLIVHFLLFCLWKLKLHSYKSVLCKHGPFEGRNESQTGNSTWLVDPHLLAWGCMDTKKNFPPLVSYLEREPLHLYALSLDNTTLISEPTSDTASPSSKFPVLSFIWKTWQGSGVRHTDVEVLLGFLLCQAPEMKP